MNADAKSTVVKVGALAVALSVVLLIAIYEWAGRSAAPKRSSEVGTIHVGRGADAEAVDAVIFYDDGNPRSARIPTSQADLKPWGGSPFFDWSGPLTSSYKPHGRWSRIAKGQGVAEIKWFWYGEPCTEGDFVKWSKGNK